MLNHYRRPNRTVGALALLVAALLLVPLSTAVGQNTYEDLQGRFAFELPEGWEMVLERLNIVYQFKGEHSARMVLTYLDGETDLAGAFADQVDNATSAGFTVPPPGSVADMTLNGCPARWAEYSSELDADGATVQMFLYIGAVVDEAAGGAVQYMALMSPTDRGRYADDLKHSFETLRLHDRPLTGVTDVQEADVAFAEAAAQPTSATTFEHELLSVTLPPGWTAEPGEGVTIAVVNHDDYGSLRIMGQEKDGFGESRDEIYMAMREGILESVPSVRTTRGPWDITSDAGETIVVEQMEGNITSGGEDIPKGVIIAAAMDGRRGLGFLVFCSADVTDDAVEEIISILKSLK
jgi:hypothetical protein